MKNTSLMNDPAIGFIVDCLKNRGLVTSGDIGKEDLSVASKKITKTLAMLNKLGIIFENGRTAKHAIKWKVNPELDDHAIYSVLNSKHVVGKYVSYSHITIGQLYELLPMGKADIIANLELLVEDGDVLVSNESCQDLNRYYRRCLLDEIMGCKVNTDGARNSKSTVYKAKHRNVPVAKREGGISGESLMNGGGYFAPRGKGIGAIAQGLA